MNLASRSREIFESSEADEKHQFVEQVTRLLMKKRTQERARFLCALLIGCMLAAAHAKIEILNNIEKSAICCFLFTQ